MSEPAEIFALDAEEPVDDDPSQFSGPLEWYWHFSQRADFQTDSDQLRVLNALLGQGMSSRLFNEIREKRGLAYNVYSFADSTSDSGDQAWPVRQR